MWRSVWGAGVFGWWPVAQISVADMSDHIPFLHLHARIMITSFPISVLGNKVQTEQATMGILTLFRPSILSNDGFVNPCLFTINIFEGHDCDETKLHFFSKKTWYFDSDNKLSFSQFWWIRQQWFEHAILQQYQIINSVFVTKICW